MTEVERGGLSPSQRLSTLGLRHRTAHLVRPATEADLGLLDQRALSTFSAVTW
ncbi:hypothetical protein [Micromonospora sp. NPDC005206]|uniref:hypothetical protein n=1 Tax=Micromonospora sp. NPDC005206 TaxID=3157022 RepID=UPI0033A174C9